MAESIDKMVMSAIHTHQPSAEILRVAQNEINAIDNEYWNYI